MKVGMHKTRANAAAYFKSVSDYIRRQGRRKTLIERLATRVDQLILIEENTVSIVRNKCAFEEMPLCFLYVSSFENIDHSRSILIISHIKLSKLT